MSVRDSFENSIKILPKPLNKYFGQANMSLLSKIL